MSRYEKMTNPELIELINDLQARQQGDGGPDEVTVELQVHQAELEIQNRELRETQSLLELSRDRYANLFDFAPIGYLTLDKHGVVLEINLTGSSMLGRERAHITGYPLIHYLEKESVERFWSHLRWCRVKALQVATELEILPRNGTPRPVQMVTVPCKDVEAPAAFRCALVDLADRKRAQEERERYLQEQESRMEAESANRAKDEFLAMLSHELRTPLNSIQGWLYLLRLGKLGAEDVKHALDVIDRSVRAQVRLINDLLDLSRLVRGKVELEKRAVNITAVVESALESMSLAAAEKRLVVEKRLEQIKGYIEGDPQRLEQVAGNLIHNALKFTPQGGRIDVELQRAAWPNARPAAVFTVRDTGIGIAPHILPMIFDRFRQGDSSVTRRHGGLGLGLAIARSLIEMHGGTLRAESAGEGKGSAFIVTLPLVDGAIPIEPHESRSQEESARELPPGGPVLTGVRALVVDDDPFARELLRRSLEPHGADVRTAASAAEGLQILREFLPQILVCDIAMPVEDGYSLIRKIRALPRGSGKEVRAIALTAFVSEADRQRALASGFNAFVPKPVEPMELVKTATRLLA